VTTFESTDMCATCGHLYVEHWDDIHAQLWCHHINVLGRVCPCKGFLREGEIVEIPTSEGGNE